MSSIYQTLNQMESNTNRLNFERGRANLGSSAMDQASFLQLLMAQLKNQDPTDPVDDSQFIQQQAMFTQIDKLTELNKTMTLTSQVTQASSLVGKYVEVAYVDEATQQPVYKTGLVDSFVISNGNIGLRVGDLVYDLNQVTQVYANNPVANNNTGNNNNNNPTP